jgi:hypothetical protein
VRAKQRFYECVTTPTDTQARALGMGVSGGGNQLQSTTSGSPSYTRKPSMYRPGGTGSQFATRPGSSPGRSALRVIVRLPSSAYTRPGVRSLIDQRSISFCAQRHVVRLAGCLSWVYLGKQ